jgi:hypothetical protein
LGRDAIRFSTRPSLGGYALVVEIVRGSRGDAGARLLTFYGHPGLGWEPDEDDWILLNAAEYRQLAAQVDAALARSPEPVADPDNGEIVVCTDGPGFLTERVRNGAVVHLTGSCPTSMTENHPNRVIATAIQDMLCRHREPAAERDYWSGRRCFERVLTMAEWQAESPEP